MVAQLFPPGSDKILHKMGKNAYLYNPCVIFYQIMLETVVSAHILTLSLSVSSMLSLVSVSVVSRSEGVKIIMIYF